MKSVRPLIAKPSSKAQTGITGFGEITGGGLPHDRTPLLVGGPGSGKTLFALQFLMHGARDCKEPGIFAAFEENSRRIIANSSSFHWKLDELVQRKKLYFMDAQPSPDLIQSGSFDINGMLAALEAQIKAMGARRIVFDALDIVLAPLPDAAAKRRDINRPHECLLARELTGVLTWRSGGGRGALHQPVPIRLYAVYGGLRSEVRTGGWHLHDADAHQSRAFPRLKNRRRPQPDTDRIVGAGPGKLRHMTSVNPS